MALKAKPKSFELDILSEAEMAMERIAQAKPIEEVVQQIIDDSAPELGKAYIPTSPMSKWHANIDMNKLPAMTDEEAELFDKLRVRGSYVVVIKKGKKYYLESRSGDVDPRAKPLKTSLVEGLIKKDWLHRSVKEGFVAFFITSHMVYGWRKRIGI